MLHITSILSHPINPNRAEGLISAFASSDDSGLAYRMFSLSPTFMISTPKQLTILTETTNRNNNPEQLIPNERTGACGITTITRKYTKKKECLPACPPASQPENQKHHHQSQPQPSSVALEEKKRKKRIRPSSQLSPHRPIYLRASSFHVSPLSLMSVPKSSSASFQEVEKLFSTRFGKEWVAQWCCSLLLLLYGKYHLNDVMSPFLFFFFLPS